MNNLTKIAALPQAGGCMSALPAEVGEQPVKVQMKAPYFAEEESAAVYWIPATKYVPSARSALMTGHLTEVEAPTTIEELARKFLAAHEAAGV